jgi:tryptophan synthase alpha subunit
MSRLAALFERSRAEKRVPLMPFLTVGYPDMETSIAIMKAMVAGGAEGIEVGIPFSDPLADGPAVQRSTHQALLNGTKPHDAIDAVRRLRADGVAVPLILMGYCNLPRLGRGIIYLGRGRSRRRRADHRRSAAGRVGRDAGDLPEARARPHLPGSADLG